MNYDAWLTDETAYARFCGLDYDDDAQRARDYQEAQAEDDAIEAYYEAGGAYGDEK